MLIVDEAEALRAEQRLQHDRTALAAAVYALKQQSRRTLTRPSTLALLMVVGGLAATGSGTRAARREKWGVGSIFGPIVRSIWSPLLKAMTALAVDRALRAARDADTAHRGRDPRRPDAA
ncbi:MAG TPA: hypothetical protein VGK37_05645 [Casimicrobiaceae bacterium]|jgi:hypothetical protein